MQAHFVRFDGPGRPLVVQRATLPILGPGEILVANRYATLCRSDLNTYTGKRNEKVPTILGHEVCGNVVQFGPEAPTADLRGSTLHIGDRVTWAIYACSPDSARARARMPQKAPDLFKYGHERLGEHSSFHGGLAEFTVLRRYTPLLRVHDTVPDQIAACINCAFATIAGALRLLGDLRGQRVLISGAGMLGTVACAMAKTAGAMTVVAADTYAERANRAIRFGADHALVLHAEGPTRAEGTATQFQDLLACQCVLECSGSPVAMETTLQALDIGGTAVWVGAVHPMRAVRIDAQQLVRNLWTLRGLHNYNDQDFLAAVNFLERHHDRYPFLELIEDRFTLMEAEAAFRFAIDRGSMRAGIRIQGG